MASSEVAIALFGLGAACFAFVIGGNLYEVVVCVPRWRSPGGLQAWRTFTGPRHAGYFFLSFAPIALVLLAAGTALGIGDAPQRTPWAIYTTAAVLAMLVFTRVFFIPRNLRLFMLPTVTSDDDEAARLLRQWIAGNYVRVALSLTALASAIVALRR